MKAALFAACALFLGSCTVATPEVFPRLREYHDSGAHRVLSREKVADLQASFSPSDERFDIGAAAVAKDGCCSSQRFTFAELECFWRKKAAGRSVCLRLDKNNLSERQLDKLVSRLAEYLFTCGVQRVRIQQNQGLGVAVLFDQTRK